MRPRSVVPVLLPDASVNWMASWFDTSLGYPLPRKAQMVRNGALDGVGRRARVCVPAVIWCEVASGEGSGMWHDSAGGGQGSKCIA